MGTDDKQMSSVRDNTHLRQLFKALYNHRYKSRKNKKNKNSNSLQMFNH